MIALTASAKAIIALASKDEGRFSLNAIHVLELRGDAYRLEATDGKRLVVVQGSSDFTKVKGMPEDFVPGETYDYLIGRNDLEDAFKGLKPDESVAVSCEGDVITLIGHGAVRKTAKTEGRFPDIDMVIPKEIPRFSIKVNPDYLASICKAAKAFNPDDCQVVLNFYKHNSPMGVSTQTDSGTFDAILMPLEIKGA